MGLHAATDAVTAGKGATFPRCLQNVHMDGENVAEKGQNYRYPHDYPDHYVEQTYLPDDLKGKRYYKPAPNQQELAAAAYWEGVHERARKK